MQFSFHVQSPKTSHSTKDCNSTASQCCISVEARGLLRISSPSPIRSLLHRFRQKTSFFCGDRRLADLTYSTSYAFVSLWPEFWNQLRSHIDYSYPTSYLLISLSSQGALRVSRARATPLYKPLIEWYTSPSSAVLISFTSVAFVYSVKSSSHSLRCPSSCRQTFTKITNYSTKPAASAISYVICLFLISFQSTDQLRCFRGRSVVTLITFTLLLLES